MSTLEDTRLLERVRDDLDRKLGTDNLEDLEFEPRCEGQTHAKGGHGHNPDQTASWFLIAPCHGLRIMVCNARRDYLLTLGLLKCSICDVEYLIERWIIRPIPGSTT